MPSGDIPDQRQQAVIMGKGELGQLGIIARSNDLPVGIVIPSETAEASQITVSIGDAIHRTAIGGEARILEAGRRIVLGKQRFLGVVNFKGL